MNYLSNCCGEPILDPDPHGHGKCSECYENCVPSNVSVMLTSEERNIKSHTNLLNKRRAYIRKTIKEFKEELKVISQRKKKYKHYIEYLNELNSIKPKVPFNNLTN